MELFIASKEEYDSICKNQYQYFYNSANFHDLNKSKVENVTYLIFKENKNKLALAVGKVSNCFKIPYSAPFGIFEKLQNHITIEDIEDSICLLENYAKQQNVSEIFFRLPPSFYDVAFVSKLQNVLIRMNYRIESCDLNYHFFIRDMYTYEEKLMRNAKKNLKKSMLEGFEFVHCELDNEKKEAYDVIAINRSQKGYPLRMSYGQVYDTVRLTEHDFFLLKKEKVNVAAAIVFKVNEICYQVVYWGDINGYQQKRPMNLLAYKIYEYYTKKGIKVLDIGPSTEDGIPNYGLCDFKESIGCDIDTKYTYKKILR